VSFSGEKNVEGKTHGGRMKHPQLEILQDYFENALDKNQEKKVKAHVESCDHCTDILSDFVMIETRVRAIPERAVSQNMEAKIFRNASELLKSKQQLREHVKDWKENIFPEIRIPALQLASVSLMLATFIAIEKVQSTEEIVLEPLSNEVKVYEGEKKA
jgi:hypothetical protein